MTGLHPWGTGSDECFQDEGMDADRSLLPVLPEPRKSITADRTPDLPPSRESVGPARPARPVVSDLVAWIFGDISEPDFGEPRLEVGDEVGTLRECLVE